MTPTPTLPRLMRLPEVLAVTGYSRASLHRMTKRGDFPQAVKLGTGQGGAMAWRSDEVQQWIDSRPRAA